MSKRGDGEENGRKQGEGKRMNGWKPKMGGICRVKLKERRARDRGRERGWCQPSKQIKSKKTPRRRKRENMSTGGPLSCSIVLFHFFPTQMISPYQPSKGPLNSSETPKDMAPMKSLRVVRSQSQTSMERRRSMSPGCRVLLSDKGKEGGQKKKT